MPFKSFIVIRVKCLSMCLCEYLLAFFSHIISTSWFMFVNALENVSPKRKTLLPKWKTMQIIINRTHTKRHFLFALLCYCCCFVVSWMGSAGFLCVVNRELKSFDLVLHFKSTLNRRERARAPHTHTQLWRTYNDEYETQTRQQKSFIFGQFWKLKTFAIVAIKTSFECQFIFH